MQPIPNIISLFQSNLDVVFFIYGLAFVTMGIAVLMQPKKESGFKLANILWLLAAFGLIHGANELLDMWRILKGGNPAFDIIRTIILWVSFLFLFEFGRQLLRLSERKYLAALTKPLGKYLTWALGLVILFSKFLPGVSWETVSILSRYFIGFPGALFAGLGFILYFAREKEKLEDLNVRKYFIGASLAFLIYGILGGLVVPKGNFFPASRINADAFLGTIGIPPQVFRALCALTIAWAVYGMLGIFNWEAAEKLKKEIAERKRTERDLRESKERYETVTETSPDCIKLFDRDGKLLFINQGGLLEHRLRDFEEALRWDYLKGIIEEDREKFRNAFQQAVEGKITTIEIRHTSEGSVRAVCLETMAPVKDAAGQVAHVFGVSRDITKIKQLEEMREFFVHTIIHDLRNPLAGLLLSLDNLARGLDQLLTEPQKHRFQIAKNSGKEINDLITNLLDVAEMETKGLRLQYEKIELNLFLEEISASSNMSSGFESKIISCAVSPDVPPFLGDRTIIKRVIVNLIGNALKFAPQNSTIELKGIYARKANEIVIMVKDEGEGIPPEYQPYIFEKFVQADQAPSGKKRGYGIGLSFCKMAVQAHGGRIWVESNSHENKGNTFCFTIPARTVPADTQSSNIEGI